MSGLISSYFGILRRQDTYFQINNILAGTVAGLFLTKLVTTNLGGWSYLVFTLATLGMFSLVRDGWSTFQRNRLHRCCKAAYEKVTLIFKPEILNPLHPGNPHFMKEDAQRAVDDAKVLMDRLGIRHPGDINVDDRASVAEWYEHLRPLRRNEY